MSAIPFNAPQEIHAQYTEEKQGAPVCEFEINKNIPGQFCVSQIREFKPGDSNSTTQQRRREQEIRDRALARRRKNALNASSATFGDTASNASVLYADPGQCIPFAREISGLPIFGTARNVPVTSTEPKQGDVVLTRESDAGHAAFVKDVEGDTLVLIERNLKRGYVTIRKLSKFSPVIRGYFTKDS